MVGKFAKDFYNKNYAGEEDECNVEIMQENLYMLKKELENANRLRQSKVGRGYDSQGNIYKIVVVTEPKPEHLEDATKFVKEMCADYQALSAITSPQTLYEEIENIISQKIRETAEMLGELSPITGKEKYVILTIVDDLNLCMQHLADSTNLRSHGLKMYMQNRETGQLYIANDNEVTIKKSALINAKDYTIMNILNEFSLNFTEDQKIKAYERAKEYVEKTSNTTQVSNSVDIETAYRDMVQYSVEHALKEIEHGYDESARRYEYNTDGKTIAIQSGHFQKVLDEIGCGYTKTVFCKKLKIVEAHKGIDLIVSNRSENKGYGYNVTGNRWFYKFNIVDLGMEE